MRTAVAVYARISQDRSGEGLGVRRQLQDCRAEAERRGWDVAEEYVDDDLSAYSGKQRPAYEQMLSAIRNGDRDAVIVWHVDRLTRRPIELEEFAQACEAGGVRDVVTLHGDLNLSNGDGLLMARFLAAGAAWESDRKSQRTKRKMLELAQAGKPSGGGPRPFGFNDDRVTLNEAEADAIRTITARFLAGEPLVSLARWLDANEVRTVGGHQWRSPTIRNLLMSPRIAGLRQHQGRVIGKAAWPAIISEQDHERIVTILSDPNRRTNRAARRYLLSGPLVRCGLCGNQLYTMSRHERGTRRYLCRSGPNFNNGCGGVSIKADWIEELIYESVLLRLDTPELADALNGRRRSNETAALLSEEIAADQAQLKELAGMWARREIDSGGYQVARVEIDRRLTTNRRRQATLTGTSLLDQHVGKGSELRRQWPTLTLNGQRAIIKAVLDHAEVNRNPSGSGSRRFDPSRVVAHWAL